MSFILYLFFFFSSLVSSVISKKGFADQFTAIWNEEEKKSRNVIRMLICQTKFSGAAFFHISFSLSLSGHIMCVCCIQKLYSLGGNESTRLKMSVMMPIICVTFFFRVTTTWRMMMGSKTSCRKAREILTIFHSLLHYLMLHSALLRCLFLFFFFIMDRILFINNQRTNEAAST